jgi:hypothetical protein
MSEEFDASQLFNDEPISEALIGEQERIIEELMQRPNALSNARLHAQNELLRIINRANRIAWRSVPPDLRAPSPDEKTALLQRLSDEDREKLLTDAHRAVGQRRFVQRIEDAYHQCMAQLQAEQEALAQHEEQAQLWAEFEAFDEAGKAARFEAWWAARKG